MEHALNIQQVRTARAHDVLGWFVNPDDPDSAFASINDAATAGHAGLPPEEDLVIIVAPGKAHNLAPSPFEPPVSRNTRIICLSLDGGRDVAPSTSIVGAITLPDASAEGARRQFELRGVDLKGDLNLSPKWNTFLRDCSQEGSITRTHGAHGAFLRWDNVNWQEGSFTDIDACISGDDGDWYSINSQIKQTDAGNVITFIAGTKLRMYDSYVRSMIGNGAHLFNMSNGANQIRLYNSNVFRLQQNNDYTFIINGGSTEVMPYGTTVFTTDTNGPGEFDFGTGVDWTDDLGQVILVTDADGNEPEPLNPPLEQLIWHDSRTMEQLACNAAGEWCVGDLKRKELRVDVGVAAADHDCGWDPPAASATIKTSQKILKPLTGAGGAVKAGFGTKAAGDPDKYGLPAALGAGAADQNLNPTWNDGGGDDLGITGCTGAGVAAGTLAGSGDKDVQIMVWYREPVAL